MPPWRRQLFISKERSVHPPLVAGIKCRHKSNEAVRAALGRDADTSLNMFCKELPLSMEVYLLWIVHRTSSGNSYTHSTKFWCLYFVSTFSYQTFFLEIDMPAEPLIDLIALLQVTVRTHFDAPYYSSSYKISTICLASIIKQIIVKSLHCLRSMLQWQCLDCILNRQFRHHVRLVEVDILQFN